MKLPDDKERECKFAEYDARRKREGEERERKEAEERKRELVRKSAEQKAHWERMLAKKSAHDDDLVDGRLTREEINIKILDKLSKAYEKSGGKDSDLEFLISGMLPPWSADPYKKVAYELRYSLGDKKQYLKEIAVEFDIPSYEEIEAREREEEERKRAEAEARQKREQIEKLTPKLVEQKARWERERNKKLTQSESVGDGSLTREEINIKILDKIFKAYESSGGESYGLNSLLDDLLDRTHRDPYEWVAYNLQYSVGDKKELLEEIAVEFEIPSYEEIQEQEWEETERARVEAEARQQREIEERKRKQIEELTPKLVEQKARWKHALAEKSARGECATGGSLTREEINIKILDKLFKAYEAFGGEDYGLYSLLDDMLHDTHDDPYKLVAYKLRYVVGQEKELVKEIAVEFGIPSYEEIQEHERAEEDARQKRESERRKRKREATARPKRESEEDREQAEEAHREREERERKWAEYKARRRREREERERKQAEKRKRELVSKLEKQKTRWERELAMKSGHDDKADGSLMREDINIKILDKLFKAYDEPDRENFDLYILLDKMLSHTYGDPYKTVAYELKYSVGNRKEILKEIAVQFDILSYEEIEERDREGWERKMAEEDARREREEIAGGIISAIGAIFGFFIGFFLKILFKNPPKNNSQ